MGGKLKTLLAVRVRALLADERAVSASEYAIMLALIAAGSITIIGTIGRDFQNVYMAIAGALPG